MLDFSQIKEEEIKESSFIFLKKRLTILNYNLLLIIIGNKIINYIEEWFLLKNYKVPNNKKYYINILNKLIINIINNIFVLEKKLNTSIIIINNNREKDCICAHFFENFDSFDKDIKRIFKKNKIKIFNNKHFDFYTDSFLYKGLKTLKPNGEEEDFLKKITSY